MACIARLFPGLARPATTTLAASIRQTRVRNAQLQTISRHSFHTTPRRLFPDPPKFSKGPSRAQRRARGLKFSAGSIVLFAAVIFYFRSFTTPKESPDNEPFLRKQQRASAEGKAPGSFTPTEQAYQEVYNAIAKKLEDDNDYDDGSYGPVLLRLGWHASGTYDAATGTGGSNGATMRFAPESDHGANAGLTAARRFLEPIHGMYIASQRCWSCFAFKELTHDDLQKSSHGCHTLTSGSWLQFARSRRWPGPPSHGAPVATTGTLRYVLIF